MKRSARFFEIVANEAANASVSAPSDPESNEAALLKFLIGKADGMMSAMARVEQKLAHLEAHVVCPCCASDKLRIHSQCRARGGRDVHWIIPDV